VKKRLIRYLILILGIYLVIVLSRELFNLLKKGERIEKMEEKIEGLKMKNQESKERLEYVKSEEFVEKEVRDKLNMAKEDEVIVVLPEGLELRDQQLEASSEEDWPNWKRWLKLFF